MLEITGYFLPCAGKVEIPLSGRRRRSRCQPKPLNGPQAGTEPSASDVPRLVVAVYGRTSYTRLNGVSAAQTLAIARHRLAPQKVENFTRHSSGFVMRLSQAIPVNGTAVGARREVADVQTFCGQDDLVSAAVVG